MLITREFGFDMGHCLPDHKGACYRPHGHRYTLQVTVEGEPSRVGSERGMVIDFSRLKSMVQEVIDDYDHRFAMSQDDPRLAAAADVFRDGIIMCAAPPTVEFLVESLAAQIGIMLADWQVDVTEVKLWETPTCWATWNCEA